MAEFISLYSGSSGNSSVVRCGAQYLIEMCIRDRYQGFADVGMGRGAIVIGLAAVIIGEAVFGRIFHNFALKLASVCLLYTARCV